MGKMIALNGRRADRIPGARLVIEDLSTGELLRLHERHFGPLDARGKRRLVAMASANGWDRDWDIDVRVA